jgi:diguanylate cyclase (GGDEF)-like protein
LRDVLERKLISADNRSRFGVAMIDLDGFKSVNDQRGHHAGDELLQLVAERLLQQAGPDAVVARIGGDEFIVILNEELGGPGMAARMSGLIASLAKPARIDGVRTHIAASLGYALFPESGQDFDALLRSADEALYAAKGDGKARARGPLRLVQGNTDMAG